MPGVASGSKIAFHRDRLAAYLNGERILPVTLELDITSECTRRCNDCPSARSTFSNSLSMRFVTNLLSELSPGTSGLLLTGGEPTNSPIFPDVLALARARGFQDIAVVTNGSRLDDPEISDALTAHASTIRLSMYDWDEQSCGGAAATLGRISRLRALVDKQGSPLQIGISALTSHARLPRLRELGNMVRDAGAHWIYFHPMCTGWRDGRLVREGQDGVLELVAAYRKTQTDGFSVHISAPRYTDTPISFDTYHAANFLMVVGADGVNYLGAEVKYQRRFALARFGDSFRASDLHSDNRTRLIRSVNSRDYIALNSRHRGVLYNDLVHALLTGTRDLNLEHAAAADCWFPHIL